MSENCIFCRIIQHQVPAHIITEDEHVIVFLALENHPLVAPRQHIPDIEEDNSIPGRATL